MNRNDRQGRRAFLRRLGAAGLCGGFGMTGCGGTEPPLRVATNVWPGYELMHLAAERGYFPGAAVRMIVMPSATACLRALAAGNVEAAGLTLDEVLSARADNLPLTVVAVLDVSLGADVLLARPAIRTLAALAGKRIAVEKTAVGAVMLDAALRAGGLAGSDVHLVYATVDTHESLFREGRVDAVVTFEPVPERIVGDGAIRLFDSSRIPGRIVDVLAVRRDVPQKSPRALRALVAGHFRALGEFRAAPADAAASMARRLGIAPEDLATVYGGIELPDVAANHGWMKGAPSRLLSTAQALQDVMIAARLLPREGALADLADARFLPEAAS